MSSEKRKLSISPMRPVACWSVSVESRVYRPRRPMMQQETELSHRRETEADEAHEALATLPGRGWCVLAGLLLESSSTVEIYKYVRKRRIRGYPSSSRLGKWITCDGRVQRKKTEQGTILRLRSERSVETLIGLPMIGQW